MEDLKTEELINVINDYIKENYDYNYADIFEDAITYNLGNGKTLYLDIRLDIEEQEEQD